MQLHWGVHLREEATTDLRVGKAKFLRSYLFSKTRRRDFGACSSPKEGDLYFFQALQAFEMTHQQKRYSLLFVRWLSDMNEAEVTDMSKEQRDERVRRPTATTYKWSEPVATAGRRVINSSIHPFIK